MRPIPITVYWARRKHWYASGIGPARELSKSQRAVFMKLLDAFMDALDHDIGRPEGEPEKMTIRHPGAPPKSKYGRGVSTGVSLPQVMWDWIDSIPKMPSRSTALHHAIETHPGFQAYLQEEEAYQEAVSAQR